MVGPDGFARVELLGVGETAEPDALVDLLRPGERLRPLQVPLVSDGEAVDLPVLAEIRAHHQAALAELRPLALMLVAGQPALDVELVPAG